MFYFFQNLSEKHKYGPKDSYSWYNIFGKIFKGYKYISPNSYQSTKSVLSITEENKVNYVKFDKKINTLSLAWSLYFIHLFLYNNRTDPIPSFKPNQIAEYMNKQESKVLDNNIKGYMAYISKNIESLQQRIKKKKTKKKSQEKCSIDSSSGICKKSKKQDNNCRYNESEKRCVYSEKYMETKPNHVFLIF